MIARYLAMLFIAAAVCLGGCQPSAENSRESANPNSDGKANQADSNQADSNQADSNQADSNRADANRADANQEGPRIRVLFWNVESEGADPKVIAQQIEQFSGVDVFAFCEVAPSDRQTFEQACGKSFQSKMSRTGNMDRLQIAYDAERFELVGNRELDDINFEGRYRSPLVVHLRDKKSEVEFLLMTNHLARGKEHVRQDQAQKLVDWARDQKLPVIAIGDFNFDFVFETEKGNRAFEIFMRDGIWKWVRPKKLIDSNWYDPEGDGVDNYPGSILDFAFVAGAARDWKLESNVIVRPDDFPDDLTTSDHRPIELLIELPAED